MYGETEQGLQVILAKCIANGERAGTVRAAGCACRDGPVDAK